MPPKKQPTKRSGKISKNVVGNVQTVVVKVGETKKRKRAPRKPRRKPDASYDVPMRQLPPVVYQIPEIRRDNFVPSIFRASPMPTSIMVKEPAKIKQPILEDIGQVGTEGRVEILDLPTRKETMAELITPVSSNVSILQPPSVQESPSILQPPPVPQVPSIFDFGMEQVYDDPERESLISSITKPTFRRPKKKGGTLLIDEPLGKPQASLFRYFEQSKNPFQTSAPPKPLLPTITESSKVSDVASISSPSGVAGFPMTVVEPPLVTKKRNVRSRSAPPAQSSPMIITSTEPPIRGGGETKIIQVKKPRKPRVTLVKGTKPDVLPVPVVVEPASAPSGFY